MTLLLLLPFTESLPCFGEYIDIISCSSNKKTSSGVCSHAASGGRADTGPGSSDTKAHKCACPCVVEPALWAHVTSVSGLNLKTRQHIPAESARATHRSVSAENLGVVGRTRTYCRGG